jgi:ABC-type sugar transport system permease subunit/ABC-type glycerol-3-phosphate transport system substrate-binding protein
MLESIAMESKRAFLRVFSVCLCAIAPFCVMDATADPGVAEVEVARLFDPNYPDRSTTKRMIRLMREDPGIRVTRWGGLALPGGGGRAPLMMAIAGDTAPDIMDAWFHIVGNDIRQGFLYPLNEWIGDDQDGNGLVDPEEAVWSRWGDIHPLWRQVVTDNGKIYGIPQVGKSYMGVIFRTDMIRAAGLNPERPPQTWDELIYWCQKLTDPAKEVPGATVRRGQRGIALYPYGFTWLPWMQSAGGDPIVQVRASPTTGREYVLPPDTVSFTTPEGEDLSRVEPQWRANFAAPEGIQAVELYHRLRWMKWIMDPVTGEPIELSSDDLDRGSVAAGDRVIAFRAEDIITGVARGQTGQRGSDPFQLLAGGEVAMMTWFVQDLNAVGDQVGIDPDLLSWFPFPASGAPGGRQVVQMQNHYAVMSEGVGRRPKAERDKVWKVLEALTDQEVADEEIRNSVLFGMARFVNPEDLKRLGLDDYLQDVPAVIRENFARMADGTIGVFTEPYMGFWVTMDEAISRQVISMIISDTGEHFDYRSALEKVQHDANTGLMFGRSQEELDRYRPAARIIFTVIVLIMAAFVFSIIRSMLKGGGEKMPKGSVRSVQHPVAPWLILAPALLLVALWSYYPLMRGMVMAFQDYRIVGESDYVGLDNFIALALDRSFWMAMLRTVYFVVLSMGLGFCAPILLALMLAEIPVGKYVYRTFFFLPQVTSGLVIALLWKMMYDPTPQGFLNQVIAFLNHVPFVDIGPQTWLLNPQMAMFLCVIPTVWASMGMASLIYLAALKSVPEELYEAADVDGAGIFTKLRAIALPTLLPLIIINFVGAFIGTFQNMGSIFLLTFGGPGEATTVVGLLIWKEAYNNLRFSMATSMAWVLGSLLIGFTLIQIRFLRRVEFRKAEGD